MGEDRSEKEQDSGADQGGATDEQDQSTTSDSTGSAETSADVGETKSEEAEG